MKHSIHICKFVVVLLLLPTGVARSQACPEPSTALRAVAKGRGGTLQDYQRAVKIRSTFNKLAFKTRVEPHWIADSPRFWYRNETRQGKEFILVDAEKGARGPAFDHARLAEALSQASGQSYAADKLPFDDIEFIEQGAAIRFNVGKIWWACNLETFECEKTETPKDGPSVFGRRRGDSRFSRRPERNRSALRSPDGKWEAFRRCPD